MNDMNVQLAEALQLVASQLSGQPQQTKTYNRKRKKTVLPLTSLLDDSVNTKSLFDRYTWNGAHNAKAATSKHTISATGNAVAPPLNEDSFFIDCTLDRTVVNATFGVGESILSVIPARPSIFRDVTHGFITSIDDSASPATVQNNPCDDPQSIGDTIGACKISYPLGRQQLKNQTGEIDVIIQKACQGIYDDFVFIGDIRGNNAIRDLRFTSNDRNLIQDGAILKSMKMLGRNYAKWMTKSVWQGDPTNNSVGGGYKEYLGLLLLVNDTYSVTLAAYLTGGAECDALNSDVKDFASACINGGGLWELMLEADHTIMLRENLYGLERDEVLLVMHPIMLRQFSEVIPCEMVGQGCNGGVVNANDGGNGLFNLQEQNRIRDERAIVLNGTTYRIILDSGIPVTTTVTPGEYISTIFGIPLRVNGEDVLYMEYNNYSDYMEALAPVDPFWNESTGWSDGGKYFHTIERKQTCFEVTTKVEPRLIFKAPHLTWRIDNVKACYLQDKPSADLTTGVNP